MASYFIPSVCQKVTLFKKVGVATYQVEISNFVESIEYTIRANELPTIKILTKDIAVSVNGVMYAIEIDDFFYVKIWYGNSTTEELATGACYIYDIVFDLGSYALTACNFLQEKLQPITILGDGSDVSRPTYTDFTLLSLANKIKTDIFPSLNLIVDSKAGDVTCGSVPNKTDPFTFTLDNSWLDELYKWSKIYGFYSSVMVIGTQLSLLITHYAFTSNQYSHAISQGNCIDFRLTRNAVSRVKVLRNIRSVSEGNLYCDLTFNKKGQMLDMANEGYYKNLKTIQERRLGRIVEEVENSFFVEVVLEGSTSDLMRPGQRLFLDTNFGSLYSNTYVIQAVVHSISARDGFKTRIKASKTIGFTGNTATW